MDEALQKLGYDTRLRKLESIAQRPRGYVTALSDNIRQEPTPFTPRTMVSKGTIETTGGGLVKLFDTTGGTLIFTYDPDTGAITLNGALVNISILNAGTIKSSTFIGTFVNTALINNGTYNTGIFNTPAITGGTWNQATLGSPIATSGTFNAIALGSPSATSGTYNQAILGSPTTTSGTFTNGVFGTPTITSGTFTNKLNVATGANQSIGRGTLVTGIATISTTAVAANSFILLTPNSSGVNLGILSVGTIVAGTSFVVNSSNALDNDSFTYWLIN